MGSPSLDDHTLQRMVSRYPAGTTTYAVNGQRQPRVDNALSGMASFAGRGASRRPAHPFELLSSRRGVHTHCSFADGPVAGKNVSRFHHGSRKNAVASG